METLKKFGIFFAIAFAVIGAGCSLGWLGYQHEWIPFAGCLIVIAMAVPTGIKLVKKLLE